MVLGQQSANYARRLNNPPSQPRLTFLARPWPDLGQTRPDLSQPLLGMKPAI